MSSGCLFGLIYGVYVDCLSHSSFFFQAISPDSQEKLCMAMESVEIHEEEHYSKFTKLKFDLLESCLLYALFWIINLYM